MHELRSTMPDDSRSRLSSCLSVSFA